MPGEIGNQGSIQNFQHGRLSISPDGMCQAPRLAVAALAVEQADIEIDRTFYGLDNLAHRGFSASLQNLKATELSAPR